MKMNALANLIVTELASVLAGPSVGMFFAEHGASVTKFENSDQGGDVTRSWKLGNEDKNAKISAYFSSVNYKKKYQSANLKNQEDLARVLEQIKISDILIVNFKKGDAEKFGLTYSILKSLNPKLIYAEISGFGESSDRVAYDLILQAESGFMSINGTENSGPVKMPVALIDILAGHQLKEGILVGLLNRSMNGGKGCRVHVSLYDSAVASLANQASNWLMTGVNPKRIGSRHPNISPYGDIFLTRDQQQMTLAVGSDLQFEKLCKILNLENLHLNPSFNTNQKRVENRNSLEKIIAGKILEYNAADLQKLLNEEHVPAAIIKSIEEVFSADAAKNLIVEEMIDGINTRRVKTVIYKIEE